MPIAAEQADVVIVGAGLSGAVAACRLAEAGMRVTCLEQGRRWNAEDYRGRHDDWEVAAFGPWHGSPNVRRAPADYPIDDDAAEMKPMLFNGVGGSTILYGAHWMRFLPSDFRVRSLDGVGDDWPVAYEHLAPYYDRADAEFGASGIAGDPAFPPRQEYPLPQLPIGAWGTKVAAAHNRLGWHWWPGSNSIASRPYRGRRPCVQRGTCGFGCNEGAKGSVDVTHWPEAERLGVRLIAEARVEKVTIDAAGRADGVVYRTRDQGARRLAADAVILAAGAIGTPRLLLLSAGAKQPRGLANGSDLVGRRLMMHPFTRVVGLWDEPMASWQGQWGQSLYCMEFAESDVRRGFVRGAKWNLTPTGGPLHAALFPWPNERLWGEALHRHVATWLGRSAFWGISCEDLPDPGNRAELHPTLVDSDGLPGVRLNYRISENSRAMLRFNAERAEASLREAGAATVLSLPVMPEFGWHPLGTCRSGGDPETSVVDAAGRAHDVPNLYIVDGSVFVTGSCVNPSATIAAWALRAADLLVAGRRDVKVAA